MIWLSYAISALSVAFSVDAIRSAVQCHRTTQRLRATLDRPRRATR